MSEVELLDLTVVPFEHVKLEDVQKNEETTVLLYMAHSMKPKKTVFELPVIIDDPEPHEITIRTEEIIGIVNWYHNFARLGKENLKFLLFAKSDTEPIGSGFVSSDEHFFSFIAHGINEFLYVTINKDVFNRLIQGNCLLPQPLVEVMTNSLVGITTVSEILTRSRERNENYVQQMNQSLEDFQTETTESVIPHDLVSPLTTITVWRKYEVLLYSLNNIFFAIDEHFKNLSRTKELNPDLVRDICVEILEKHKNEDEAE